MLDEKLLTKDNHYYPQFLIRNWANEDGKVCKILINSETQLPPCSVAENLFSKRVYDNATEAKTGKDDSALATFVKRLKDDTNRGLILQDSNFLRLIFKLFARQPKLNEASYNSVKNAILNEPYMSLGVKRYENFDSKAYKRMVNHALLATSEYDISESWMNATYVFGFNKTQKPFILPDNTKALILPLTPRICVGIEDLTQTKISVKFEEITDIQKIDSINKILMSNCDSYYISKC